MEFGRGARTRALNHRLNRPADTSAGVQNQFVESFDGLDKASQDVEDALANVRVWKEYMAMIEGPTGDAIAADAANSKRLNALIKMDRVSPEQIAQTSAGISRFRKLLDDRMERCERQAAIGPRRDRIPPADGGGEQSPRAMGNSGIPDPRGRTGCRSSGIADGGDRSEVSDRRREQERGS